MPIFWLTQVKDLGNFCLFSEEGFWWRKWHYFKMKLTVVYEVRKAAFQRLPWESLCGLMGIQLHLLSPRTVSTLPWSFTSMLSSLNPSRQILLPEVEEPTQWGSHTRRGRSLNPIKAQVGLPAQCFPLLEFQVQGGCGDGEEELDQAHRLPREPWSDPTVLPYLFTRSCSRKANAVPPPPSRTGVLSWTKERGGDNSKEQQREVTSTWVVTSSSKSKLINITQRKIEWIH